MRKTGLSQSQVDAFYKLIEQGAKIETIAELVGYTSMGKFKLSEQSLKRLNGVHNDLVRVVKRAIELSEYDFMVIEGLRSMETQRKYFDAGKSKTLNSFHLTGHAVDLAPLENGSIDWKNSKGQFNAVAKAMKQAAKELNVKLEWGGDWRSFVDMPHFQIER